jgi:hypothetical protein
MEMKQMQFRAFDSPPDLFVTVKVNALKVDGTGIGIDLLQKKRLTTLFVLTFKNFGI